MSSHSVLGSPWDKKDGFSNVWTVLSLITTLDVWNSGVYEAARLFLG